MSTALPQVDVNIPRFNQGWVALLTGVAFVVQWWPLVAVTAAIVAVTRFAGPGFGLFTQLYLRVVRSRLGGPVATEWAAPPRFSQLLAVIFLTAASVLLVTGLTVAGWVITLLVTALATLASAARICVGCIVYEQMVQGAGR